MSRSNLFWLLLLLAAGAFLAFTLFQPPESNSDTPTAVAVVNDATATAQPAPVATADLTGSTGTTVESCDLAVPLAGGIFQEGIIGVPLFPNPLLAATNPVDHQLIDLIFDGLVAFDASGQVEPALAESWTVSEDGLTITFTLRNDVLWHDGQPFDAGDVAFTYGLLQADGQPDSVLWQSVNIIESDPQTIAFQLESAYSPFMQAVSRGILPEHVLGGLTLEAQKTAPFNTQPIGTGPFAVANSWLDDGFMRLTPHDAYWRQTIGLDAVDIKFLATEAARAAEFANGGIDALIEVAAQDIGTVFALDGAQLFSAEQSRYTQLLFNLSDSGAAALANSDVRRALELATDKNAIVQQALAGQAVPFSGPFVPSSWAASPTFPIRATNSISAAFTLEVVANWLIVEPSGPRIRTTGTVTDTLTLTLITSDSAVDAAIADLISKQWQGVGAEVLWEPVAQDALQLRLMEGTFDVALTTVAPLADPDLYDFWSQDAIVRGQNYGAWNNQRASEALEEARQLWTVEERGPNYGAFNREFAADVPAISLFQHVQSYVVNDGLISAETSDPVAIPRITRPRDRFSSLPTWRINTEIIQVDCADS